MTVQPALAASVLHNSETDNQITATAPNPPEIHSEAAIVMDATTGQILYEKNAYSTMYPASITKILTTLVALENGDLDSMITMSENAVWGVEWDSSQIGLQVGEQITLRDALYATMLASANEAAWGVAEHIGGDLETFSTMMNDKAKELGCVSTHFVNANGLHNDNHYTCAYDMALITKAALENPDFVEITSTKYSTIEPTNLFPEVRYLTQGNNLIMEDSEYYYEYCYGGKTGYTTMAQGTLVAWAECNGVKLICVTLKSSLTSYKYEDTIALFDYCFENYSKIQPLANYQFTNESITATEDFINDYYGCENLGSFNLSVNKDTYLLVPNNSSIEEVSCTYEMETDAIDKSIAGTIYIKNGEEILISVPVSYEGYINSEDKEAVEAAIAAGIIEAPKDKSINWILVFFIIILVIGAILAGVYFYLRLQYIKKKRKAYIKKRNLARKNGKPF